MEIRKVLPQEYEQLGELTVQAYMGVHPAEDMTEYAAELRDIAARVADADVLVAVDAAGSVVGGVTYVPGPDSAAAEFTAHDAAGIRMLAVAPQTQGRGIGEALVRACINQAQSTGRGQIVLHSTVTMKAAHRLYLRLGFERDESLDWLPEPELWLLGFRLKL